MKVVFCSSEVAPYAKTGGLADVCGSLPFALLARLPLLGGIGARLKAIDVADLARCFIICLDDETTIRRTLEGRSLWATLP